MNDATRRLTAIDLFAGAGGFSLAAKNAGMRVLAAVENEKWARQTYKRNFVKHRQKDRRPSLYGDITTLDPHQMMVDLKIKSGDLDILIGGPPCQGFSTHRIKDAGVADPRNALLLRYFLFVEVLHPKAFVVENVPGLLWPRHREYLESFKSLVRSAGYHLSGPTVLNARDYGVPQNRKRVFMVGLRGDLRQFFSWPASTHYNPESDEVTMNGMPSWEKAQTVFDLPLRYDEDPNAINMKHSPTIVERFRATPLNGGSRSDSGTVLPCHRGHDGHKDVYGRIDPKKPGPTMTAACTNPSRGRFVHPTEHHGIAVRHAARFQTFPEDFVFDGGLMAGARQVGNAVPVLLGEAILVALVSAVARIDTPLGGEQV